MIKRKNNIIWTLILILAMIIVTLLPLPVAEAANFTISKSSISLENGKSSTITINAPTHTGRLDIISSNPDIAISNENSIWIENNSKTITISGKTSGTATITIKGELYDSSTESEEIFTKTINVNVSKKTILESNNTTTGSTNSSNTNSSSKNNIVNTNSQNSSAKPNTNQSTVTNKKETSNIVDNNLNKDNNIEDSKDLIENTNEVINEEIEENLPIIENEETGENQENLQESFESQISENINSNENIAHNNLIGLKENMIILVGLTIAIAGIGIILSKKILRK